MAKVRRRLGELLVDATLISLQQLENALILQKQTQERLGEILLHLGYISEEILIQFLAIQLNIPHIFLENVVIVSEVTSLIPQNFAERYTLIPIEKRDGKLTIAMADPTNLYALDDARMISGLDVVAGIATKQEILRAIDASYGIQTLVTKASNMIVNECNDINDIKSTDDAPVIRIVNTIITQAIREKASDIHIEPTDTMLRVRFRIDGELREIFSLPVKIHAFLVSRIKIMSALDIAEKRLPQDGRIRYKDSARKIDLRVSTMPTIIGEKVVIRVLDLSTVVIDVQKLGFSKENLNIYTKLYQQSYGMILVTGPTNCGKTTTLYSTLVGLNTMNRNIITIEDPVEYHLYGVNQVQVNTKAGLTFVNGLRSILRQDPNVIMIGEIRDSETANIAIRAALTGHLVFSTLHTNNATGAISRLIDMGVEPFLVASSVLGVLAQRLVRIICAECKKAYTPDADSPERTLLGKFYHPKIVLYRGRGCPACGDTGYQGRLAIHEILPLTKDIRELIDQRASTDQLKAAAIKTGMTTLYDDGIEKVLNGYTTVQEVMRVAYADI